MWTTARAVIIRGGPIGHSDRPVGGIPVEMLVGLALIVISLALITLIVRTVQANMPS